MSEFTPNFNLELPEYDSGPWKEAIDQNFRTIDGVLRTFTAIPGLVGAWANSTAYTAGNVVIDNTTGTFYVCAVSHTSASSPTTFADDRTAHPTYWTVRGSDASDFAAAAANSATQAAASAAAAAASASSVAVTGAVFNLTGTAAQVRPSSNAAGYPTVFSGYLNGSLNSGDNDIFIVGHRRTDANYGVDGPRIDFHGSNHSNPRRVIIYSGDVANGYNAFVFDDDANAYFPGGLLVQGAITAPLYTGPGLKAEHATVPIMYLSRTTGTYYRGFSIDGSGNFIIGATNSSGVSTTPFVTFSSVGAATFASDVGAVNLSAAGVYATTLMVFNSNNTNEWRAYRNSGLQVHEHRANWYESWNESTGERVWASPFGAFMTLGGTGTFTVNIGDAYKTGGGSWSAISDERVKEIRGAYTAGLNEVLGLEPVTYVYIKSHGLNETTLTEPSDVVQIGLVAQQTEKHMPEIVGTQTGYIDGELVQDLKSIRDTTPIIFALVNAIKELSTRVIDLEARL